MKFKYEPMYAEMTREQIRNAIRRKSMSNPVKFAAIQSRAERVILPDGRKRTLIRCCHCEELFRRDEIEAHHVNPVGRLASTSREDVIAFGNRLFVGIEGFQALCIACHRKATRLQKENLPGELAIVH